MYISHANTNHTPRYTPHFPIYDLFCTRFLRRTADRQFQFYFNLIITDVLALYKHRLGL